MANTIYPSARELFLNGDIDWANDDIRAVLVDSGYVYSASHNYLDDVSAGTRVATSTALTGKTSTSGVADAADKTLPAVTGDPVTAVILYKHTGVESTSPLIAFYDTDAAGVPIALTPNGNDIDLLWSNSSSKIFRL